MIGWIAVIVFTVAFAAVMGGLLRTAMRPLDETDEHCAQVDMDLDRAYGGWRL